MKQQNPVIQLENAYWANWCGDKVYARRKLIQLADEILGRNGNEPETPRSKQKKAEEVETIWDGWSDDKYLIR